MKPLIVAGFGFELVVLILGTVWLGPKLDEHFQTQGIIFVVLLIVVLVGWFLRLIFLLQKWDRDSEG
jgi:hypothetical protein